MSATVAVAHHDPSRLKAVTRVISLRTDYPVLWTAGNAIELRRNCESGHPDILLLDLEMTLEKGSSLISDIMKNGPCLILILSDAIDKNSGKVFEAMGCGALDVIATPVTLNTGTIEGGDALIRKLATIAKLSGLTSGTGRDKVIEEPLKPGILPPLIAVGSSTGGPKALATLLSSLPEDLNAAIIICQHVDRKFALTLAEWLNSQTALKVEIAQKGMKPQAGVALVAGTNDHLVLEHDLTLNYTPFPGDYPYRPSVNTLFESLLKHWPRKDIAILLTGMGRDGGSGLSMLRAAGWHTIVQDEKTSIVYGMPLAAVELGAAIEILPLEKIAGAITAKLSKRKDSQHDGKQATKL